MRPRAAPGAAPSGMTVVTLAERPDLSSDYDALSHAPWPEFMHHSSDDGRVWRSLNTRFAAFQVAILDPIGTLLAVGRTIPLVWTGTPDDLPENYQDILIRGARAADEGRTPNTVSALLASVSSDRRGQGMSRVLVSAMRDVAIRHGATALIAPVRPTWKERYPLTPIDRYVKWTVPASAPASDEVNREHTRTIDRGCPPFDPWLRTHWRLGAERIAVDPDHFVVRGSVADWESWTGMSFPETGPYIVPGALVPIHIDRERDTGLYEEPAVWMHHRL